MEADVGQCAALEVVAADGVEGLGRVGEDEDAEAAEVAFLDLVGRGAAGDVVFVDDAFLEVGEGVGWTQ